MGANLSNPTIVDISKDILSPGDIRSDIYLLLFVSGSFYAMGMIFGTTQLVDHWRGPYARQRVGCMGVLTAIILSTAWPVILFYVWCLA